jgi:hypothetical protein
MTEPKATQQPRDTEECEILQNPKVTVLFDGLMVFMKGRLGNTANPDYQARLHTQAHGHEVRIAVYKNNNEDTPEQEYVFQPEEITNRFEHLWFYTTQNNQPKDPDACIHRASCRNILNLKTLLGNNARPRLNVLTPVVHFRNGQLSAAELRNANC